jgi:flagellar motor switch protein FliM
LTPALAALRFEIGGQPCWLTWDSGAALGALETALGSTSATKQEPRALSSIERAMFLRLLTGPVTKLARALDLEATGFAFAADADAFGSWQQGGERAEPRRLVATLEFEPAGGAVSAWSLYLAGVGAPAKPVETTPVAALPHNLEDVAIELVARLGSGEVALSELLALEVGDVIPLQHKVGEPLEVVVEDHACLRGMLGKAQGKLGVRITGAHQPPSEA